MTGNVHCSESSYHIWCTPALTAQFIIITDFVLWYTHLLGTAKMKHLIMSEVEQTS